MESLGNLESFPKSVSIPRFVEHIDEAQDLRKLLKEFTEKRSTLIDKVRAEIIAEELAADKLFIELRTKIGLTLISDTVEKAARKRLESGNPPGKEKSLGDRVN